LEFARNGEEASLNAPRCRSGEKDMKTKLVCPACGHEQLARIARRGFLRQKLYPMLGFYPWECAMCRKEFLIRRRGAGYRRVSSASQAAGEQVISSGSVRSGR
jgi:ribosomal protein L37AE/L43A